VRRHVLVAYDIADDKRRNKVAQVMEDHGDRVQYSVFLCQLNGSEQSSLRSQLRAIVNAAEDQVMLVDLGLATRDLQGDITCIGKAYSPPVRAQVI